MEWYELLAVAAVLAAIQAAVWLRRQRRAAPLSGSDPARLAALKARQQGAWSSGDCSVARSKYVTASLDLPSRSEALPSSASSRASFGASFNAGSNTANALPGSPLRK